MWLYIVHYYILVSGILAPLRMLGVSRGAGGACMVRSSGVSQYAQRMNRLIEDALKGCGFCTWASLRLPAHTLAHANMHCAYTHFQ